MTPTRSSVPAHEFHRFPLLSLVCGALLMMAGPGLLRGEDPAAAAAAPAAAAKSEKFKYPKWDEAIKGVRTQDGLLKLHLRDGSIFLEIRADQLGTDYLVMSSIGKGIGLGWLLTGMTLDEWLVTFKRVDSSIHLVRRNIRFKAQAGTPMGRAVELAYADSVIASLPIKSVNPQVPEDTVPPGTTVEESGTSFLVDVTPIFVSDLLGLAGSLQIGENQYAFDSGRSILGKVKAFPRNLEIRAELVFRTSEVFELETIADSRSLPLTIHYSIAALPEAGYQSRLADDRVGHFVTAIKDYSSEDEEGPFVRFVNRWRLEKADPKAKLSAPKAPIVFYLEKTIPYRYRHHVREGILEWNRAFEKLGFADALEVRIQSDQDDWDPEDARYNTIRWTPGSGFAIGPSRVDPRTGEILDADILLDDGFVSSWTRIYRVYLGADDKRSTGRGGSRRARAGDPMFAPGGAGLPGTLRSDLFSPPPLLTGPRSDLCAFGVSFGPQVDLAAAQLVATGRVTPSEPIPEEFIGAALKDLTMHEVGHTLGLRHNFAGSTLLAREDLHKSEITREKGLIGSVMDYNPINLAGEGETQGEFYPSTIGPYDHWAIEYAYKVLSGGTEGERKDLDGIAGKAPEPGHRYATDEDTWPIYNRNLDPLAQPGDMGADPLDFAKHRTAIIKTAMSALPGRIMIAGKGYQRVRDAFGALLWNYFQTGIVASVYIGGQTHVRYHQGDAEGVLPFTPIPARKQKEALDFLAEKILADPALDLGADLLNSLAPDHWMDWGGTAWSMSRIDFPIHQWILAFQAATLDRLLDPSVLHRIRDTELKYPGNKDPFTLPELFGGLSRAIWKDLEGDPRQGDWSNRQPLISGVRRELQRLYLNRLIAMVLDRAELLQAPSDARTLAWSELGRIRDGIDRLLKAPVKLDDYSSAHLRESRMKIGRALEAVSIQD